MLNLNKEMLEKVKTPEELITLAKENGTELTLEQAQELFEKITSKSGELSDDELDEVTGGN